MAPDDRLKPVEVSDNRQPTVYATRMRERVVHMDRRSFLGLVGTTVMFAAIGSPSAFADTANVETASPCYDLFAHSKAIRALTFNGEGTRLVSGGQNGTIKIWSLPEGHLLSTLRGHSYIVNSLAFSADGEKIVSGSGDETIKIWAANSGKLLKTLFGIGAEVKSIFMDAADQILYCGAGNHTVSFWSFRQGIRQRLINCGSGKLTDMSVSPDGRWVVCAFEDGTLLIFDASSRHARPVRLGKHEGRVNCLGISHDGHLLASGGYDGRVYIWDIPTGKPLQSLKGHQESVYALAFSPDDRRLVSGGWDKTLRLWSLKTGETDVVLEGLNDKVRSCCFSPDGRFLSAGYADGGLHVWSYPNMDIARCLFDENITNQGTEIERYRIIEGEKQVSYQLYGTTYTVPCGTPVPPGAVCTCDCVASAPSGSHTVCICDTVSVPAGSVLPPGAVCVCNTVSVGTMETVETAPSKGPGKLGIPSTNRFCSCDTVCTCNLIYY